MPTTDRNYMNVLWGKLASEILMQDWDNALDDLNRLREVLDSNVRFFCFFLLFHNFQFHILRRSIWCCEDVVLSYLYCVSLALAGSLSRRRKTLIQNRG